MAFGSLHSRTGCLIHGKGGPTLDSRPTWHFQGGLVWRDEFGTHPPSQGGEKESVTVEGRWKRKPGTGLPWKALLVSGWVLTLVVLRAKARLTLCPLERTLFLKTSSTFWPVQTKEAKDEGVDTGGTFGEKSPKRDGGGFEEFDCPLKPQQWVSCEGWGATPFLRPAVTNTTSFYLDKCQTPVL